MTETAATSTRTLVVAVDGSEHSDYALDWFCKNVHKEGDHVILVYVPELHDVLHTSSYSSTVYMFDREALEAMLANEQARIRADLEVFAQKLKHHGLGGKVKSVMSNKPGEGIIRAATEEKADMIILGSRGQGTLRRTFMGSVSDYVVHHAHVPVFVCKHPDFHHHEKGFLHDHHNDKHKKKETDGGQTKME